MTPSSPQHPISVLDMLKIGIGPSSSHTLGPWRAIQRWLGDLGDAAFVVARIRIELYGSLAQTGRGHATDMALCLALLGHQPETIPVESIDSFIRDLRERKSILLPGGNKAFRFDIERDIVFHPDERLPEHANGMCFTAWNAANDQIRSDVWYSIGGGFVQRAGDGSHVPATPRSSLRYPIDTGDDLLQHCASRSQGVADTVRVNEMAWRDSDALSGELASIWRVMRESVYRGCHESGALPGGLGVRRRAPSINRRLLNGAAYVGVEEWIHSIRGNAWTAREIMKWTSCFAIAVNEENASLGRVVTAPTNGAAGVLPAVLLHELCFGVPELNKRDIEDFLLVAGEIGSLFKKGATISAAMGGCQAEIGVSSAMSAAALVAIRGGTPARTLMAAEIAMEHHLGMTCDPVGGLVQVPCIERNAMGAIKAINAAELALELDPAHAVVSLDDVIRTMWETAQNMRDKYKETSTGGLAVNISVRVSEC